MHGGSEMNDMSNAAGSRRRYAFARFAGFALVLWAGAAAGSFARLAKTVGGTDERSETVLVNSPRDGYNFRAAATAIAADGSTINVPEWTHLGLRGMGLGAQTRAGQKRFLFSVQQPS